MSVCRVRLILWLILAGITILGGITADLVLHTSPFPLWLRVIGLVGILLAHFPLKRTGRLLSRMADPDQWGCTNQLVTNDLYGCVRHPHHFFIGIFMTCLGLAIGHIWSFLLITSTQWIWILGFLFLVEEKELRQKFGEDFAAYQRKVPILIGDPSCLFQVLSTPLEGLESNSDIPDRRKSPHKTS
jgi:protein-S-isoprenylcysteine O-methyltransferase Ste14